MISKAKVKYIKSLQVKKYRKQEQSFLVEGAKGVEDLLRSDFRSLFICATPDFIQNYSALVESSGTEVISVTAEELNGLGSFQTNDAVLAVAQMQPEAEPKPAKNELVLVLDDIRDPGNLGTIIRTADWYGVQNIVASEESADFYNPKVISATMGSFTHVKVYYAFLPEFLAKSEGGVYGAFLDGTDVHTISFQGGLIVIGNESRGISPEVEELVNERITIKKYGEAESLNAAMATGIILDNLVSRRG